MIQLHAAVIFLSYLAFFLAVVTGVVFLLQERWLKRKNPKILWASALPQELLDRINLYCVIVGFLLFTLGMLGGHLLARTNWGAYFSFDPKEISSLLTWGAYLGVLGLRLKVGLRGRRVVLLSVMSFALVVFTFIGVNYLVGGRHVFF